MCTSCKGAGVYDEWITTDYHKREGYRKYHTCKQCEGVGRLWKVTEITYKPYEQRKVKE